MLTRNFNWRNNSRYSLDIITLDINYLDPATVSLSFPPVRELPFPVRQLLRRHIMLHYDQNSWICDQPRKMVLKLWKITKYTKQYLTSHQLCINSFMTEVPIIWKPVYWFAEQINGKVFIIGTPVMKESIPQTHYRDDILLADNHRHRSSETINPFQVTIPFLYPMKTSKYLWFSNIFRRYRKVKVRWVNNGFWSYFST